MSDRDESTGQFSSAEPLYGQAGLEHDAGFVPFQDGAADEEPEELTAQEAGEKWAQSSTPESEIRTYSGVAELDANISMTLEQAAKIVSDSRDADDAEADDAEAAKLRKEVDELRGVDPEAKAKDAAAKPEAAPVKDGELEPELEKALNHPRIKEAISSQIAESETARQTYSKAAEIAMNFAQVSFAQSFPEVAGLPPDQWANALAAMSQREPARFQAAVATLDRVGKLQNAQQFEQQRQEGIKQQEFAKFAKAEDARLDDMLKGESPKAQSAIMDEILAGAEAAGLEQSEFLKLFNTDRSMRHSAFQKMMVDAAKYRLLQKAKTSVVAAGKTLPHVQRPGVAASRGERNAGNIAALNAKFGANPTVENAAALYAAQSRARG